MPGVEHVQPAVGHWADFLRSQADALLACDFFDVLARSSTRSSNLLRALREFEHVVHRQRRDLDPGVGESVTGPLERPRGRNALADQNYRA